MPSFAENTTKWPVFSAEKITILLKIWPEVKVTGKGHVAYQLIRIVELNTSDLFSSLWHVSIKSYSQKTAGDRSWPEMTSGAHRGVTGAFFLFSVSCLPMNRCLRAFWTIFVQKRRISIFSHWLIMERSQNWPDLRSQISKIRDIHFIHTVTHINRWKFQSDRSVGVAIASLWTFSEVRSLDVTWWPDLERPRSEIFTTCAEMM